MASDRLHVLKTVTLTFVTGAHPTTHDFKLERLESMLMPYLKNIECDMPGGVTMLQKDKVRNGEG